LKRPKGEDREELSEGEAWASGNRRPLASHKEGPTKETREGTKGRGKEEVGGRKVRKGKKEFLFLRITEEEGI